MSNNQGSVMRAKLEDSGEWDAWWEELLSRTPKNIIRLFDPESEETELPEPSYPSLGDVNEHADSPAELDEDEMTKYKNLLQIHQFEKQRYDSQQKSLVAVRSMIYSSVGKSYLPCLRASEPTREWINSLKQHAGASADEAVKLARAEYRRVLEKGRTVSLKDCHEWLEEWDIVMANATKNDISESVGSQWVDDFANVMAPFKAWYADHLRLAISRDEVDKLSYRTVSKEARTLMKTPLRQKKTELPVRTVRGGAYVTAFGGESSAAESDQPIDEASSSELFRKRAGTNSQARDRNPKRGKRGCRACGDEGHNMLTCRCVVNISDRRILEKNKKVFDERMASDAELRKEVEAIRKKTLGNLESVMA